MASYSAQIALADKLIKAKGQSVTVTRKTETAFNPVTGAETATSTDYSFSAVPLPPDKTAEKVLGSLVDRRVTLIYFAMKGQTIAPEPNDVVTIGGVQWTIRWTQALDPGGDGPIIVQAYADR